MPAPPLRVVQWATGNIGSRALRHVIEHPDMELAGVFVYSPDKAGRDAGELCGLGRAVGVKATNSVDEIAGLHADCVLYMPQATDVDDVCRVLESGANIVTTRGDFHRPASLDPAVRERIEKSCEKGGTSIHSTGSSPGFITEALPIVLASIQRHLDALTIDEFADLSQRNSPELLFDLMGYGKDPDTFDHGRWEFGKHSFGPSLELLAESLSMPLDSVEASGEVAVATRDIDIAAGTIKAGTVAAQRMIVSGMRGGRAVLQMRPTWYCTTEIDPAWDLKPTGWHVFVDGDAPLDIDLLFPVTLEQMGDVTPGYTANRAVNAVPYVCAAAPGIRTTFDMPQIVANLR